MAILNTTASAQPALRVILADDNAEITALVKDYLADKPDVELVGCASDGVQALALLRETPCDVLVMDLIMPALDGFAVLTMLDSLPRRPRTLVLTALGRGDFITRAMQLGADYYMLKPFGCEELYRQILAMRQQPVAQVSMGVPEPTPPKSLDEEISSLFLAVGIPAHIKGYQYLREAVRMVVNDPDVINRITKELYPGIARTFSTSASKVERAIRHAIEVAWNRGRIDAINATFGCRVFSRDDKPTNGEFIALIADKMLLKRSA
ncbi:MAG TPA: sporulation transcription factor Spo0A [Candidatus Fimadaptatus faecigallinarum]|uniref:Stage 0 sporulation protein A homolog n=1 Tax=Candidatus Fimadaptatus faecigallinarum TaxID=2840814 RepID=A0A9D1LR57_9FIRM|nr:sporulation transcription factor Spo0A [Candidatus Fimadaptatus faecigallinarum]